MPIPRLHRHVCNLALLLLLTPLTLMAHPTESSCGDHPHACAWEGVDAGGKAHPRHENGFVLSGERFYMVGGRGIMPVDIFDPETGQWSQGAAPPLEVHHFQPVADGGKVYVVGGMTGEYPRETPLEAILIYDTAADAWSWGPEIPAERRRGSGGTVLHEGHLYWVAGIIDGHWDGHVPWLDRIDLATGNWEVLPDAPRARDHFHAVILDGKLYAAGGRRSTAKDGGFAGTLRPVVPEVDVYDLERQVWTTLEEPLNLPTPRAGAATAAWRQWLIVAGGETIGQQQAHTEVEAFDTQRSVWVTWQPLKTPRHGAGVLLHNDSLYLAGGNTTHGGGHEIAELERLPLGEAKAKAED